MNIVIITNGNPDIKIGGPVEKQQIPSEKKPWYKRLLETLLSPGRIIKYLFG